MNDRVEELTDKVLSGTITPDEDRELHGLLAANPDDHRRYFQLLAVEIELRNLDDEFDVSDAVMRELAARPASVPAQAALSLQESEPLVHEPESVSPFAWLLRLATGAGVAAMVVAASWWIHVQSRVTAMWVVDGAATAEVLRDEKRLAVGTRIELQAGDRLRLTGDGFSKIHYEDGTTVQMRGPSELVFQPAKAGGKPGQKRLELRSGVMFAEVVPQPPATPLAVRTADALAVVRGTRFQLRLQDKATRLDVFDGAVEFTRNADDEPVTVLAGTFVRTGTKQLNISRIRSLDGLVAYYTFEEGQGVVLRDRSGYGEPVDLFAEGKYPDSVEWSPGGGARFAKSAIWMSRLPAKKIVAACREARAITVEAWITPDRARQAGPARIVTVSKSSAQVNFQLGHGSGSGRERDSYVMRLRTTKSNNSGYPVLETRAGVARAELTHLVFTHAPDGKRLFYVNGRPVDDGRLGGDFRSWVNGFKIALSNDAGGENRFWQGRIHLVAIYARALSKGEVEGHFESGPRQYAPSQSGIAEARLRQPTLR